MARNSAFTEQII